MDDWHTLLLAHQALNEATITAVVNCAHFLGVTPLIFVATFQLLLAELYAGQIDLAQHLLNMDKARMRFDECCPDGDGDKISLLENLIERLRIRAHHGHKLLDIIGWDDLTFCVRNIAIFYWNVPEGAIDVAMGSYLWTMAEIRPQRYCRSWRKVEPYLQLAEPRVAQRFRYAFPLSAKKVRFNGRGFLQFVLQQTGCKNIPDAIVRIGGGMGQGAIYMRGIGKKLWRRMARRMRLENVPVEMIVAAHRFYRATFYSL